MMLNVRESFTVGGPSTCSPACCMPPVKAFAKSTLTGELSRRSSFTTVGTGNGCSAAAEYWPLQLSNARAGPVGTAKPSTAPATTAPSRPVFQNDRIRRLLPGHARHQSSPVRSVGKPSACEIAARGSPPEPGILDGKSRVRILEAELRTLQKKVG